MLIIFKQYLIKRATALTSASHAILIITTIINTGNIVTSNHYVSFWMI